jgi:hypothetical protein
MRTETVDEYIARGGVVHRCPASWEMTRAELDARRLHIRWCQRPWGTRGAQAMAEVLARVAHAERLARGE